MFLLPSIRTRFSLLLILVLLFTFILYQRSSESSIEYAFPQDVLRDYTSPSTYCFWPESVEVSSKSGQSKQGFREWIGWGKSNVIDWEHQSENGESPDQEQLQEELFTWKDKLPDIIPSSGVEKYMLSHIEDLQDGYDPKYNYEEYGLKLGNISLESYTHELLSTYTKYLKPINHKSPPSSWLSPVLSRLSLRPPIANLPNKPKQIITTDKSSIEDLPSEFGRWKEIMPDYEIKYFDDNSLKKWVNGIFGNSDLERIWNGLPRQVLKTDMFRYMAMLVEGGIYTDSDTAPIIHADEWGKPYHHETAPLLTHLSRLLSLSTSQHLPSSHPLSSFSPEHTTTSIEDMVEFPQGESKIYDGPLVNDGNELGQPALVVSVESDAIDFGWNNWREIGLSRAVQITQWTFMARPGHPVFLDALGRTLRKSEEMESKRKEAKESGEEFIPETALEWTGPGVFTDCVYRYLLARYGFKPEQLIHKKEPIRVGDVLILPAGSYSSVSPFGDEEQRPWAASYHGFLGRWRDADPAVQEFERLKKIKEEEADSEVKEVEQAEEIQTKNDEEGPSDGLIVNEVDDGIPRGRIGDIPLSPIG